MPPLSGAHGKVIRGSLREPSDSTLAPRPSADNGRPALPDGTPTSQNRRSRGDRP